MKMLRRILLIILCIALIVISAGFLFPRKVHVERSLLICASQKRIFEQINTLKNWVKWSPWLQSDTLMQLQYSGPESGVGATYSWLSKDENIGEGSLSILVSVPYDSLLVIMDYGVYGKSTGKFNLIEENQSTTVKWSLESDLGINPVSRWFGLFSDRMIGPDLENGLLNLEQLMKDNKIINGFEIIDYEVPARILLSVRDTASPGTITSKLALLFNRISLFLKSGNLSPTGAPITIFHSCSNDIFDIEACMPIASIIAVPEYLTCSEKGVQKTIMVKYLGSYKLITTAYIALNTYIADNGLQITGPGWEEYLTNPNVEADTNKWQTNIYYPVAE